MPGGNGMGPPAGGGKRGGRMGGNRPGAGPTGDCVCPNCGEKTSHQRGKPCYELSCPKCGAKMRRA
jgi:hypothetical protein